MTLAEILAIACSVAGCASPALNYSTLASSTIGLACDWGQTRRSADGGWRDMHETNVIMGRKPTPSTVDLYFLTAAAFNFATWVALPARYRWVVPAAITGAQLDSIRTNVGNGTGVCGL